MNLVYSKIFSDNRVVFLVRPCDMRPCKNNGNCSDDGTKCFKCECPDGFKGFDCSKKGYIILYYMTDIIMHGVYIYIVFLWYIISYIYGILFYPQTN